MEKAYEPKKYEKNILKKWNDAKAFLPKTPAESKTKQHFTLPIPPPNVTGTLHLGHAMMVVVEDIMTRYHRMKGDATLWLPGTDHAAIATESVVLKNLGVPSKEAFTREEFIEKCFEHTKKSQSTITNQVKKMGASCDFTRERYTMDLGMSNAVWKMFKDLYETGLITRGYRMVNWSPKAQSVLADDELESEERTETFAYIKCGRFIIGTVRSETKCADSPVVIHPDENYVVARFTPAVGAENFQPEEFVFAENLFDDIERRNKIFNQLGEGKWEKISVHQGKYFEGESFEAETYAGKRKFFVMCDDEVIDINKGSGAMTISVNHAADDYLLAQKYPELLKEYSIEKIGFDGKMTAIAGELSGIEVEIARKRAIALMLQKNLIVGLEKEYSHTVPLCYRTGCVVEPMISPQWFISVEKEFWWQEGVGVVKNHSTQAIKTTLKKLTYDAVLGENPQVHIIPERFNKTYYQWINNLRDWCISRQIWWGHQIPVWYDKHGNEYLAQEQTLLFARHGESENNLKKIIGQNPALTEKGKKQAEELAKKLISENRKIAKIYFSSLKRSKETAEIVARTMSKVKGYEHIVIEEFPDFEELYSGTLEGTLQTSEPTLRRALRENTGETLEQIEARAKKFWDEVSKRGKEDGDILFIGHKTFLSMIFAVKDGRFGETLLDYRDRWHMQNGEIREVPWMMKPMLRQAQQPQQIKYDEYVKNIEELLKTEQKEKYDRTKFWTVGKISDEMQQLLEIENSTIEISEFLYAKQRGWIADFSGHLEVENTDFYLIPYFLEHATEAYENLEKNERYLIAHNPTDEQSVILVVDTANNQNVLVSYFFITNAEKYLRSLEEKNRYTKKRSLEGPTAPSCITTRLREDMKRLVVGFPSRQTPLHTHITKFLENLQEKSFEKTLRQDQDTLDTWFSSALWPFSTLGWPDATPDFENFFPTSVLETGHDILFFWVARMIMFGRFATGKSPFKQVYLHGLVCDEHGKKMSKSKGNGIDPLEMIEKFGADALRMALVVGTTPGNQVNLGEKKIEGFRNFANKLWNIARYIAELKTTEESDNEFQKYREFTEKEYPHRPYSYEIADNAGALSLVKREQSVGYNEEPFEDIPLLSIAEHWILSKLSRLTFEVSEGLENNKYGEVGQKLYDFTWNDLADWAIESAKAGESKTIGNTLRFVLENLLKLLHPYMPFITEQIWQELGNNDLLMLKEFPNNREIPYSKDSEEAFIILQNVITAMRSLRSASKVDPVKKIKAVIKTNNSNFLKKNEEIIKMLARLEHLEFGEKPNEECVFDMVNGIEIYLPLSGMIDAEREKIRKEKELYEAKKQLATLENRLNNEKYMSSAPEHLVAQTKAQHAEILEKIAMLKS